MSIVLERKLAQLPTAPGVYFHKDSKGEIIYVGKAAVLRHRVRQYFQQSRARDPKTEALVAEIADTDWMVVDSELDAIFLEAEMIRRYLPRYNILLRDDKSLAYIRIDYNSDHPTVTTTHQPLDDGARYIGPYLSVSTVELALRQLRRVFPFATHRPLGEKRASMAYQLGLDPGLEHGKTTLEEYRANLRQLMAYIQGNQRALVRELESQMKARAKRLDFEGAARLRNQLFALRDLKQHVGFSDKEFADLRQDHALRELVQLLDLRTFPQRLESYRLSLQPGNERVTTIVVFANGVPNKAEYRTFRTQGHPPGAGSVLREALRYRLSEKRLKAWGTPDLVFIEGGPQLLAGALEAHNQAHPVPILGLVGDSQIVLRRGQSNVALNKGILASLGGHATEGEGFILISLPPATNLVKLLQRIGAESYRFATTAR